ncbi:MAG: FAD-dependent monooxygenase [Pseudomonadota bacterium]
MKTTQETMQGFAFLEHAAVLPPLVKGKEARRHKVVIAGGGPVGLAAALALARYGIPSLVIEADRTVCKGSRAICLSRRSLEILDRLGALAPFLGKGLGWTAGRSFYQTTEILRFEMPHGPEQRLMPMTNLQQYYVEQFLVDATEAQRDLIDIRWGTSLDALTQDADGVMLSLQTGGTSYAATCDWLIACDGARSKARQELGLRMNGTAYEGRYIIVDVAADLDWPVERLAWFDPPSNPGRTMLMHRQPDNVWRLDYQLHPGEDAEAMTRPENVLPVVEAHFRMLGVDKPWELIWSSTYRASALSLDKYVHGRVLFAGDAAHLVPIFGVRGLNSGFDDVFNLAWKLAYVIEGRSPLALLDSYSHERHFAWRTNITHAMKSTEFMAPPSSGFRMMRDAVLSLADKHPALRSLINPRQSSVIHYVDTPLNMISADDVSFRSGPAPGAPLPEVKLADRNGSGAFLTVQLRDGFNLLVYGADDRMRAALAGWRGGPLAVTFISAEAGNAALHDTSGQFAATFDAAPVAVILVRPDGHICARWRGFDADAVMRAISLASGHSNAAQTQTIKVAS